MGSRKPPEIRAERNRRPCLCTRLWPDSRGATPRALTSLIRARDPIGISPAEYDEVSIAARGFYALEFLLYNDVLMTSGDSAYHCALVRTFTVDIATTTAAIRDGWRGGYRAGMLTGGTYQQPRPLRAEARRSGRSARQVALALASMQDLASRLTSDHPNLSASLQKQFRDALARLETLDDPVFTGVSDPASRLKIEILRQSVGTIRATVRDALGPTLGVAAGFNALDGD